MRNMISFSFRIVIRKRNTFPMRLVEAAICFVLFGILVFMMKVAITESHLYWIISKIRETFRFNEFSLQRKACADVNVWLWRSKADKRRLYVIETYSHIGWTIIEDRIIILSLLRDTINPPTINPNNKRVRSVFCNSPSCPYRCHNGLRRKQCHCRRLTHYHRELIYFKQ